MSEDSDEPPTCFNCTLNVAETIHVKCYECPVQVCMLCFQCGAESAPHRRGHNYELIKPSKDQQKPTWTHDDEFELLKAAHKFKMGNWGEIAVSMGRPRTEGPKCKDYFEKHFVRGWIGQFSIKSANWEKIKYGMYINQTLESVLQKNCLESTERMLLIRDALRHFGEQIDENDPKLAVKTQQFLEQYIQKIVDGEIEVTYERSKTLSKQYETELSADECDPELEQAFKTKLSLKNEIVSDNSDVDGPGPSCSYRSKAEPKAKRRKTNRIMRDSSSDSDDTDTKSARSDNDTYHGLERETEDEDPNESAFETAHEYDSNDEEDEKKTRKSASSSAVASTSRKRKKKRMVLSKKERRLHAFSVKMKREQKRGEKKLAGRSGICSVEECKELRSTHPRLLFESGIKIDKAKLKQMRHNDDLGILGYNVDREEFETEWFNDAEQLISRLTMTAAPAEKDQKLDIENDIKFARLKHYIRILGIRRAKRNTILEHDKINEFYKFYKEMIFDRNLVASEVLDNRPEKEKKLLMAQQFMTKDEHQAFRGVIERMRSLMDRIEILQNLQKQGETTLKHAPPTERKKKKLRKSEHEQRKKLASEWSRYRKWHTVGGE